VSTLHRPFRTSPPFIYYFTVFLGFLPVASSLDFTFANKKIMFDRR